MKRIFIGGMGRSGTTITLNALHQHGSLFAIPIETKFLVEADGFHDLLQAVTTEYSTARTPNVVDNFDRLMRQRVTGKEPVFSFTGQAKYSSDLFEHYEGAVDCIIEMVLHRNFYSTREPLLNAMRRFIAYTFDNNAIVSNKHGWVEKTPANFWRLDFLRELYPDSYFVHVIRDPRMIMWSLMEKGWISTQTTKALIRFESMLAALVIRRREILKLPRVVEVRLEELESEATMTTELNKLADGLEIDHFSALAVSSVAEKITKYSDSRNARGRTIGFSNDEATMINQILMQWVVELGYSPVFPSNLIVEQ
nr:sulfotransferase [uncultured Undibacterium sp.]